MIVCWIVAIFLVATVLERLHASRSRMTLALGTMVLTPSLLGWVFLNRYDPYAAMIGVAALAALVGRRERAGAGWLAAGFEAKVFPVAAAPVVAIRIWRRQGRRGSSRPPPCSSSSASRSRGTSSSSRSEASATRTRVRSRGGCRSRASAPRFCLSRPSSASTPPTPSTPRRGRSTWAVGSRTASPTSRSGSSCSPSSRSLSPTGGPERTTRPPRRLRRLGRGLHRLLEGALTRST